MKSQYRICTIRGELRNPQDKGTDSLTDAVRAAEALVKSGRAFPGLTVWDWSIAGGLAAIVKPDGTEMVQHG